MEEDSLKKELERVNAELELLYEVSNAMRSTLKLDEILYIILTAVTAHVGLGFNRALLFLINEKSNLIEGKMGIGPDTGKEADRIWKLIEKEKMSLNDLINSYRKSLRSMDSKLNRFTQNSTFSLADTSSLLSFCVKDNSIRHITKDSKIFADFKHDPILKIMDNNEFVIVPLLAEEKVVGLILADNIYSQSPISKEQLRLVTMFANQAGLAIENSRLYEQTLMQSQIDSLTHLWNHGFFQYTLENEIGKAKENSQNLSLVMIDIDNFKNYNDCLGHQVGDQLLKHIASILQKSARKSDFVSRYGGEEFAVILPNTNKKQAFRIAERIRQDVEGRHFVHEDIQPKSKLTISLGLATFPLDAFDKNGLLLFADRALYRAKNEGKNRVV